MKEIEMEISAQNENHLKHRCLEDSIKTLSASDRTSCLYLNPAKIQMKQKTKTSKYFQKSSRM